MDAMTTEFQALIRNNNWSLVSPPPGSHVVRCRWIYKIKYKSDGSMDRYKALLVGQGFTQTAGVDYFDTFSPTAKSSTIRIILAIAVSFDNWMLQTLFSMVICRKKFSCPEFPTHVSKLRKVIYGLKKAPRAWFNKLRVALLHYGFQPSPADSSLLLLEHRFRSEQSLPIHGSPHGCTLVCCKKDSSLSQRNRFSWASFSIILTSRSPRLQ